MAGYFADRSMAVRVMSKRAVGLTYGQRALVIGAVHPLLYIGTATHTEHRESPYTRLAITGRLFEAVFLGSRAEADRALEFTRRKHARVSGAISEDAGPAYPAGTRYDARDPHLMFMTMAFTFDSALAMHELLVRRLTPGEREGLWQDYVRWGELFGMPRSAAPVDYPSFRAAFDGYLASDQPYLTDEARLVGAYLSGAREPGYPLPGAAKLAAPALAKVIQGSVPDPIRRMYGIEWGITDELVFRSVVQSIRSAHRRAPLAPAVLRPVLRGRSAGGYTTVARGERAVRRHGGSTMPDVDRTAVVAGLAG